MSTPEIMPEDRVVHTVRRFYPANANISNLHRMEPMNAATPEEAAHLERLGWLPAEIVERPLRQQEKADADAALAEAEHARATAEREAQEEKAREDEQKKRRKAELEAEAQRNAQVAAREARINFLIETAQTHARALEDRSRRINELVLSIPSQMRPASDDEQERLAQQLLDLRAEQRDIKTQLAAIGAQLKTDMEAAARA